MRLGRMLSVGEVVEQTPAEEPAVDVAEVAEVTAVVETAPVRVEEPVTADR